MHETISSSRSSNPNLFLINMEINVRGDETLLPIKIATFFQLKFRVQFQIQEKFQIAVSKMF